MEVVHTVNRLTNRKGQCPTTRFKLFGTSSSFVLDTGTNLNIISKYNFLKLFRRPKLAPTFVQAYSFNSKSPIPVLGEFKVTLRSNYRRTRATFLVLDGDADNLLGFTAAMKLGLVSVKDEKVFQEEPTNFHSVLQVTPKEGFDPASVYPSLFKDDIGAFKDIEVVIATDPTVRPVQIPPYPIPIPLIELTREKIMKMWADGIIEPAEGKLLWLSPMHVVPKIDPVTKQLIGVRITSNNKALNKAILLEKRWMPSIATLTHELNGMSWFSKVDLRDAFNQVCISILSRNLTAFSTPWGTFRYCRLNMGLAIASEIFQNILTDILRHIPNQNLATDDIIVYGSTHDECKRYTIMVLEALEKVGATLSNGKCRFMEREIEFFGHTISAQGLKPLECKVNDFLSTGDPRNFKELHSFLGTAGYFSSRTPYQAVNAKGLRALLKKGGSWEWKAMHHDAMNKVKSSLIKENLAHFNPTWITELIVDAGPEGCASFLTQVNPKDPDHRVLIKVSSHAFTAAELNYSHVEKEAFGCVWACYKDHLHLYGTRFNLITDNIGCQKIFEEDIPRRKIPPRLEKLKSKLAVYNAKVIFRPGLSNIADYVSRRSKKIMDERGEKMEDAFTESTRSLAPKKSKKMVNEKIRAVSTLSIEVEPYGMTLEEIALETKRDPVLCELSRCIGKYRSVKRNKRLKEFKMVFEELNNHESGVILKGRLILIPEKMRIRAISYAHEGHLGIVLCKRLLRNRCWWPGIDKMVELEVGDCPACQANVDTTVHEPLISTPFPGNKLGLTSIDFSSKTPTGEYLLVTYYESGRLPEVKLSRTMTSEDAIRICTRVFREHGIPQVVKSDNGPAFKSDEFAAFAKRMGFRHHKVTPLNPEANGAVERFMRPINKSIRCAMVEGKPWKNEVAKMLRNYRATPHSATGVSPDVYMTGTDKFGKIPTLNGEAKGVDLQVFAKANDDKAKARSKLYADKYQHAQSVRFEVGGRVMHKWERPTKHTPLFDPMPYTIESIKGNMISVKRKGHSITRNSRFFKGITERCYERAMELKKITKKVGLEPIASMLVSRSEPENGTVIWDDTGDEDVTADESMIPEHEMEMEYSRVDRTLNGDISDVRAEGRPTRIKTKTVLFDANRQANASIGNGAKRLVDREPN
jgi:hypothetical protein